MAVLTFADLIDIESLKSMQDSFSKYTGLAMCVVDPNGTAVLKGSGGSEFCWRYTQGCAEGAERCARCDKYGAHMAYSQSKAVYYTCHAGMTDFVIPIIFENRVIGTILAGQVRSDSFDPEKARHLAEEFGIDPDEYVAAAMKTRYMSKETAEATAQFFSEFSQALSIMAHTNYRRNNDLERAERAARSQSNFITDLTDNLRVSMKDWLDTFYLTTEKYKDIPEIRQETEGLLFKAGEVYSEIGGAVDYMRMSGGSVEYSEGIYNVRDLINREAYSLMKIAGDREVKITATFDDELPETLAGNSGRIGQIINKLGTTLVNFTNKGGKVGIHAGCIRTDYSCSLTVNIKGTGTRMTEKAAAAISSVVNGGGADIFGGVGILTSNDADLALIVLLMKQMSGSIAAESLLNGNVSFRLTIPQLDGSKTSA